MTVNTGDILKVTLVGTFTGVGVYENVWHVRWDTPDDADEADVIDALTYWIDNLLSMYDDAAVDDLTFGYVQGYNLTKDQPIALKVPTHTAGTVDTDPLPSGVAALITLATTFKKTLGKKFLAGLAEAATTGGLWTSPTMAILSDIALYMIGTQSGGAGIQFTVGTARKVLGSWTFHEIVSAVIRAVPSYQRRRKFGVGA